jgi:hypothetical protein
MKLPFLDGMNLVVQATEEAENNRLWPLYYLHILSSKEPSTFEAFKKSLTAPKKKVKKQVKKKKTTEEILAEVERINNIFRGDKDGSIYAIRNDRD